MSSLTVLHLDDPPLDRTAYYEDITAEVQAALDGVGLSSPAYPLLRDFINGYLQDAEHGAKCRLCEAWTGYALDGDRDEFMRWHYQTLVTDGTVVWALCEGCSEAVYAPLVKEDAP